MMEKDKFKDISLCKKLLAESQKTELELFSNLIEKSDKKREIINAINTGSMRSIGINANEYCENGLKRMELGEREKAYESFEKWLSNKSYHIVNLYGAGSAKKYLWEYKEAEKYFTLAYKIATHESIHEIESKIGLEIAKINIKNWKLETGETWLDEMIANNTWNIEVYLLKARLIKILGKEKEFDWIIQDIYNKIMQWWNNISITENYEDIFEYVFIKIDEKIQQEINKGTIDRLLNILPQLESIGHKDAIKTIVWQTMFDFPKKIMESWIDIKSLLTINKDLFIKKYQEFINKKIIWAIWHEYFILAYMGYKILPPDMINNLMDIWFEFDWDYISLVNIHDINQKRTYKEKLINRIYALWADAKYMLRDYLKVNKYSILNI